MALLAAATPVSRAGILINTGATPAASDTFGNSGKQFLYIYNGNGATCTVTVTSQPTIDGLAVADLTVSILTTAAKLIGPFPTNVYNDANGLVTVVCSVTSSVTILVLSLTPEYTL